MLSRILQFNRVLGVPWNVNTCHSLAQGDTPGWELTVHSAFLNNPRVYIHVSEIAFEGDISLNDVLTTSESLENAPPLVELQGIIAKK